VSFLTAPGLLLRVYLIEWCYEIWLSAHVVFLPVWADIEKPEVVRFAPYVVSTAFESFFRRLANVMSPTDWMPS